MRKRERSEKSKYKHQTTGDYCTCAAYIAELMCLRLAERNNEGSLPFKFWNTPSWQWPFKKQLFAANSLISRYGEQAVIRAVTSDELKKVFVLSNARVIPTIKKYQGIIEKEREKEVKVDQIPENIVARQASFSKKSKLSRLREIDGKEAEQE